MAKRSISVGPKMKKFITERVASGEYASMSAYLRDLVQKDQERQARKRILGPGMDPTREFDS